MFVRLSVPVKAQNGSLVLPGESAELSDEEIKTYEEHGLVSEKLEYALVSDNGVITLVSAAEGKEHNRIMGYVSREGLAALCAQIHEATN